MKFISLFMLFLASSLAISAQNADTTTALYALLKDLHGRLDPSIMQIMSDSGSMKTGVKQGKWIEYFFRTCILESECEYEKLDYERLSKESNSGNNLHFFRFQGSYVNGVREGLWRAYATLRISEPFDWELDQEVIFKKGKPDGWKKIFSDGKLFCREYYRDGKRDSVRTCFNPDGSIWSRMQYSNDEMHGEWEQFDEEGRIKIKYKVEHNEPVDMVIYQNDGYMLKDGKPHGKFKTYDLDSILQSEGEYKNGLYDGIFKTYYASGQVEIEETFIGGESNGIYRYYHPNGKIWTEVQMKDGKAWTVISNYSPEGKPMNKGDLKDGNGKVFRYDEKGKLIAADVYKNGIRIN